MGLKVLKYDDDFIGAMDETAKKTWIDTKSNYGTVFWKEKLKPMNNWVSGFVTGHKYKIHWGQTGLDFTDMKVTLSENWLSTDKSVYLVHNYTETRE